MNELQRCILDIYKEVKKICNKYNITYYAIGGTCIGAVRHKGFIPWDDDLDIAIPIEDVDRFIEIAKRELPEYLEIFTGANNSSYILPFFKVVDSRTTFIEDYEQHNPKQYKGVFIDIMPISGVPIDSNLKIDRVFFLKIKYYIAFNLIKRLLISDIKTLKGKIVKVGLIILDKIIPSNYFYYKYMELLKSYPLKYSVQTGYVWDSCISWLHFSTDYFSKTIEFQFEDTVMACPVGYHEYLTKQFGNYMKLPPENERETHIGFIDLSCSYKEYQKNPKKLEKIYKKE